MMLVEDLAAVVWFAGLLLLPGAAVLWTISAPSGGLPRFLVSALGVSLGYLAVAGLLLLRFGAFDPASITAVAGAPVFVAILVRAMSPPRRSRLALGPPQDLLYVSLLGAFVLGMILLAPRWTFLVAPNMDAGNYEVYGNHFWRTGHLYMEVAGLLERGVPLEWIDAGNTWSFASGSTVGRPAYLYGYPVLLAITKGVFSSPASSWILNATLAVAAAATFYLLLRSLSRSAPTAFAVGLLIVATPLFLYYSKQLMSEMLALFGILLSYNVLTDRDPTSDGTSALVAGSGVLLALLAKIDMLPAVTFLVVAACTASYRARRRGTQGPGPLTLLGVAAGVVIAAMITAWLTSRSYVAGKVAMDQYLPWRASALPDGRALLLGVGVVGAVAACLTVLRILRTAEPTAHRPEHRGVRPDPWTALAGVLVLGWIAFGIWSGWVRPSSVAFEQDHEAHNLVRLLAVFSPVLVVGAFVLSPALLRLDTARRWIVLGALAAFALVLFRSRHTPHQLWWMRRYLATALPAVALVVGGALGVTRRAWNRPGIVTAAALSAAVMFVPMQMWAAAPLFSHEVNVDAPERLERILRELPEDAPLIVLGSDSTLLGMANTLQSLRSAPTLLDVPHDRLSEAARAFPDGRLAVVSGSPLPDGERRDLELRLVQRGVFSQQWDDDLSSIAADPDHASTSIFVAYVRGEDGGGVP